MDKLQLYSDLEQVCNTCNADTIALSGGLDSTIISYLLRAKKPNAISVIAEDFVATDLTYCQMAAKHSQLQLEIIKSSTTDLLNAIEKTVKILKNFNDIEIRNNVIMYIMCDYLKEHGKSSIITGDGADELFAGYNFLLKKPTGELKQELERIRNIMRFPSHIIGKALGIKVESPFIDKRIIKRSETIPLEELINEKDGTRYGKWILRTLFEDKIPKSIAWRAKAPMQDGSGTSGLTKLFDSVMTDTKFLEKRNMYEQNDGVVIRTKESMYYYELFRKHHYEINNDGLKTCPYCRYGMEYNSKFCHMCGAFPI